MCGGTGNPGGIACTVPSTNDTDHILVAGADTQTGAPADIAYFIATIG